MTIPLRVGLRWAQKHPYMSDAWTCAYNLRSTVERANNSLKHPGYVALSDPSKRPCRGYTKHAIAVAMLTVAHNVRAVDNYFRAKEGLVDPKNKHRKRAPRRRPEDIIEGVTKQKDGRKAA